MAITNTEREMYKKGFRVAMNFLFHHHPTQKKKKRPKVSKDRFETFLKLHIDDASVVTKAMTLLSKDGSCPSGECPTPAGCVLCAFDFAYDPDNFPLA